MKRIKAAEEAAAALRHSREYRLGRAFITARRLDGLLALPGRLLAIYRSREP